VHLGLESEDLAGEFRILVDGLTDGRLEPGPLRFHVADALAAFACGQRQRQRDGGLPCALFE